MSEYKEQLIELFESVSGCNIGEFSYEQLPYLADYIIGQQEADNMCIEKLKKENQRLTAIATKHATRADELYEALENQMAILEGYKRLMIHPLSLQDDIDSLRSVLDKSEIDTVSNSNDD